MRVFLPATVVAVAIVCALAGAGIYQPPPGDSDPTWTSDGLVAFVGHPDAQQPRGVTIVNVEGPPVERFLAAGEDPVPAPTMPLLAFYADQGDKSGLAVMRTDGTNEETLFQGGIPFGWQADSSRIFFWYGAATFADSRIYSIRPDGSDLKEYPSNVHGVPSPDGTRFAYTTGGSFPRVHVVNADGSGDIAVVPSAVGSDLVWSPDGSRLAFWNCCGYLVVARVGGANSQVEIDGGGQAAPAWAPDGRTVFAAGTAGLVGIDLTTGQRHVVRAVPAGAFSPVLSPDGTRVALAAGGECRDRLGIYVVRADGSGRERMSNSCTVVGTDGPDVLDGTWSQVVLGLGGNDTLRAEDGAYVFEGDTLMGGPGGDRLLGGSARDTLVGGPGNDVLYGGPSGDILIGGRGDDHIFGEGGGDTIGAQDGQRDWISCGHGDDVVYADRVDVVAADCEVVHRR